MINPEHEKAKRNALNYKKKLAELNIKEKIVKLPPGYGSFKTEMENYKKGIKPKSEPNKGTNLVNSLEISKVGRLYEKGFTLTQIARKMGIRESKARYRLKLYNDEKQK